MNLIMRKQSDKFKLRDSLPCNWTESLKISVSSKTCYLPPPQKVLGSISRENESIKGHARPIQEILCQYRRITEQEPYSDLEVKGLNICKFVHVPM